MKMLDIVLVAGGTPGLAQQVFSHATETHDTTIGPLVPAVKGNETVNVSTMVATICDAPAFLLFNPNQ